MPATQNNLPPLFDQPQQPEGCQQPYRFQHAFLQSLLNVAVIYGIPKLVSEFFPGSEESVMTICNPCAGIIILGEFMNLLASRHSENTFAKTFNAALPYLTAVGSYIAAN